jgi:hypothetical protein
MDIKINTIVSRKTGEKFKKICEKQGYSMSLVLDKYIQKVVYEGKVDVLEWA